MTGRVKVEKGCGTLCDETNFGMCLGKCNSMASLSKEQKRAMTEQRKALFRADLSNNQPRKMAQVIPSVSMR